MVYHAEGTDIMQLDKERRIFALRLRQAMKTGTPMWYADETSFNAWSRQPRSWYLMTHKFQVPQAKRRGHGQTLFGAISTQVPGKIIRYVGRATSIEDFG